MKDEKQIIEKMAKDVAHSISWCDDVIPTVDCLGTAAALYGIGYRRQSEWISVDERLPQVCGTYICCVKDKYGNTWTIPADFSPEMKTWFGQFGEVKNTVTHWMPLPEAPKGGE